MEQAEWDRAKKAIQSAVTSVERELAAAIKQEDRDRAVFRYSCKSAFMSALVIVEVCAANVKDNEDEPFSGGPLFPLPTERVPWPPK